MTKYRIVEITRPKVYRNDHVWIVQKRVFGFLWWYNPFEDGGFSAGEFRQLEEARMAFEALGKKTKRVVIYEK